MMRGSRRHFVVCIVCHRKHCFTKLYVSVDSEKDNVHESLQTNEGKFDDLNCFKLRF